VPLVCAAGWLGLASGEPASHRITDERARQRRRLREDRQAHVCTHGQAQARPSVCAQCTRTRGQVERHTNTPAVCAAVSPCGGVFVSSTASTIGGGCAGAPAVGYSEYSLWGARRAPKGTVSTRTCGMRRCADVIFRLDRRRRRCRRTCGGVLGVLTVGYLGYSQGV
jgi:hypothetical protein